MDAIAGHLAKFTPWGLARLADCANPDDMGSPGAMFLRLVRDCVADDWDRLTEHEDPDYFGAVAEIADTCVPDTTDGVWRVFTDLAVYAENVGNLLFDDITAAAGHALYRIATRLVYALVEEGKRLDTEEGEDQ